MIWRQAPNGWLYRRAGELAEKCQSVESAVGAESPRAGRKPPPVRVQAMLGAIEKECFEYQKNHPKKNIMKPKNTGNIKRSSPEYSPP